MFKDKTKQRYYQKLWIKTRRETWLKLNGPCIICKSWDNLEIDHIDPATKKYNISQLWTRKTLLEIELKKCQVLCSVCHKEKTNIARREKLKHGIQMYRVGCRCAICKQAKQKEKQFYTKF